MARVRTKRFYLCDACEYALRHAGAGEKFLPEQEGPGGEFETMPSGGERERECAICGEFATRYAELSSQAY